MLQDVINPPEQQQLRQLESEDEISSPILSKILDFRDEADLFPKMVRSSEASSCSGCGEGCSGDISCYEDASFSSPFLSFSSMDPSALAGLHDTPIPETEGRKQNDQFNPISPINSMISGYAAAFSTNCPSIVPLSSPLPQILSSLPQPHVFEDDGLVALTCMDYMGGLDHLGNTSCSYVDPTVSGMGIFFHGSLGMPNQGEGTFARNLLLCAGQSVPVPDLVDYQQRGSGSSNVQVFSDGQDAKGASGSPSQLAVEGTSLDESTFKVAKLSVEERKEKIHRYLKKRNERNFSKKIKYACRKTLADSRPRVRGRFAKNDEYGEAARPFSSNLDDDDYEYVLC